MIYFDHNAAAPFSPSVREYLQSGILADWQNPSAAYPQARILEQRIREAKNFAAERLNCSPKHLFWTSGATEAINTALSFETLRLNGLRGIITSLLEHQAALKRIEYLSACQNQLPGRNGARIEESSQTFPSRLPPSNRGASAGADSEESARQIKIRWVLHNRQGEIDLNDLEELCRQNPKSLVSLLSANNETGVITDIKAAVKIARRHGCLFHADAVQSLGKERVDLEDWDVDFASFSGHKIGAMKGAGLLFAKKPFAPLMHGGGQEKGMRPGTYNFPAIYSFQLAVRDIDSSKQDYVRELRDYFENQLLSSSGLEISQDIDLSNRRFKERAKAESLFFKVNCQKASRLPNTSSIYCRSGLSGQAVLSRLARKGICAAAGSACHAGSPEPSHVMIQLAQFEDTGAPEDYARSCLRVSFGPSNTKEETDLLIQALREAVGAPQRQRPGLCASGFAANP